MRPDLQKALDSIFAGLPQVRFLGARLRDQDLQFRFADLIEAGAKAIAVGPLEYQDFDIGEVEPVRCLVRGLWLAAAEGIPFAILLDVDEGFRFTRVRLEIAAPSGDVAGQLAARLAMRIREVAERGDSWRGKTLSLTAADEDYAISPAGLSVERLAPVRREDIVLPEPILALVERNALGFARLAQRLVELGLPAKKGVLLYGPPGTGKTMLVRWLTGCLTGYTKLIVKPEHYVQLDDCLSIARTLQPALIVLEDVDLIAGDRSGPFARNGATLNSLLNAMDGLAADARMLFVLTTNRPEVLEPALAQRPGRVDQTIEICLPGEVERKRLIFLYAGNLYVDDALAAAAARRIAGASPAFIKEFMRRAAQAMLERNGSGAVEQSDVDRAIDDMLGAGGRLAARILGAEGAIGFTTSVS